MHVVEESTPDAHVNGVSDGVDPSAAHIVQSVRQGHRGRLASQTQIIPGLILAMMVPGGSVIGRRTNWRLQEIPVVWAGSVGNESSLIVHKSAGTPRPRGSTFQHALRRNGELPADLIRKRHMRRQLENQSQSLLLPLSRYSKGEMEMEISL